MAHQSQSTNSLVTTWYLPSAGPATVAFMGSARTIIGPAGSFCRARESSSGTRVNITARSHYIHNASEKAMLESMPEIGRCEALNPRMYLFHIVHSRLRPTARIPTQRHDSQGGFSAHSKVTFEIRCEPIFSLRVQSPGMSRADQRAVGRRQKQTATAVQ